MIDKVVNLFDEEKMKRVSEAQKDLKDFLDSLPEDKRKDLEQFQIKLEDKLRKAGNQNNRIAVLQRMLREHVEELSKNLKSLSSSLTYFVGGKKE